MSGLHGETKYVVSLEVLIRGCYAEDQSELAIAVIEAIKNAAKITVVKMEEKEVKT